MTTETRKSPKANEGERAQGSRRGIKDRTVYMIGNAHIDAVWLWQWQEAFQEVKATFRSALDRLDESDDFVFTSSSAAYYWRLEGHDPALFAEIKRRIAEGRWVICGGWWVQPDCNIPSGESFVRQGLYSQRYFREKLGVTATTGYNPDAFGHNGMLPQILRKQGMDAYVFLRPEPHEKGLPGRTFWWEADDGSRVLAFRIPHGYATAGGDLERVVRRTVPELKEPFDAIMCFYGVGNHGGGPTRANLESIRAMDASDEFPRMVMAAPPTYFADIRAEGIELPVVHDELQHHARGCYAAHSGVKRWNRQAEQLLVAAEAWSVVADQVAEQPYPQVFEPAWRDVMFNQFHDILAGSSIEPAYEDARNMYGEAMSLAGRAMNNALQSISWRIDIPAEEGDDADDVSGIPAWAGPSSPIVVFNSNPWPVHVPVEVEMGSLGPVDSLRDDEGNEIPVQVVQSLSAVGESRKRLSFVADLPPLGYRLFRVRIQTAANAGTLRPGAAASTITPISPAEAEPAEADASASQELVLENDALRVTINPSTGCVSHLVDKAAEFDVLRGEGARPVVVNDPTDTWGHGLTALDEEVGVFTPVSVRQFESGPVRSTIRVESEFGRSRLRQDFTLYRDLPQLFVNATLDWQEHHRALKLRFPANLLVPRATYEIPYGVIERPTNGDEEPGQRWLDLTGLRPDRRSLYGLSLLNDSKYSFDVRAEADRSKMHYADMGMTVVRSPIYAHHDPFEPREDFEYSYMDQGIQHFSYALLPHADSWEAAGTVRRAVELNQPPAVVLETFHSGPLAASGSYLSSEPANVVVSVLKQAEDSSDLVVRAYETSRVATHASFSLPAFGGRTFEADFGACEIKTFLVPRDASQPVREVNLIEWDD
jgi:alpha-mannosidase